ncbi:sulfotransferase 1A1-like [Diadema antillarum]|uniref:sulfotransferase 1A1-like n=1 Tax=Diadema antillarum TaxID=105358 RepID=UPI003A88D957
MSDQSQVPNLFRTHTYKGVVWPNIMLDSSIDAMATFDVRQDDVWVVTYPKSGTHWMMEIAGLVLAEGCPEKIDRSMFSASICMIDVSQRLPSTRSEEELEPPDMAPFLTQVERAPSPRLIWSHLSLALLPPDLLQRAKVLYLARNPKDVVTSMYNFYTKTPILKGVPFEAVFDQFIKEEIMYTRVKFEEQ